MIHVTIEEKENDLSSRHYGVSNNGMWVLVQLDDGVNQTRVRISPDQALDLVDRLKENIEAIRSK